MKLSPWNQFRRINTLKQCAKTVINNHERNVVLCPGQSSQYVGMMNLSTRSAKMREMICVANQILGYDIEHLCQNGPDELLSRTVHCQPAVVISTLLAHEVLKDNVKRNSGNDFNVSSFAGYSVGEVSALHLSGILDFDEAIILLRERAIAMDYACQLIPSGMLTMQGLTVDETKEMCEDMNTTMNDSSHLVSIAIEQYPKAVSLGGSLKMLNKVMNRDHKLLKDEKKIKLAMVNVSGAFHTQYMLPAQEQLDKKVHKLNFRSSNVGVYSNVTGHMYDRNSRDIPLLLVRQIAEPVLWNSLIENMKKDYRDTSVTFYEVGPGKQLKSILSKIDRSLVRKTKNISL